MLKMEYQSFEFVSVFIEDEQQYWHWARFYFSDERGEEWIATSPTYAEGSFDLQCLREDAIRVSRALSQGANWEQVCLTFRQAG